MNGSISCLQFTLTTTKQSIYNTAHKCLKNKYTFSDFNLCHFPIGLKAYSLVTFNVWWCGVDFILYRFSIFSLTLIRCLRCFVSFHSIPLLALRGSNFWFRFRFRFNIIIFLWLMAIAWNILAENCVLYGMMSIKGIKLYKAPQLKNHFGPRKNKHWFD